MDNLSHIFLKETVTSTFSEIIEQEYTWEQFGGQQSIIAGFTGTFDKTNGTNIFTKDPVILWLIQSFRCKTRWSYIIIFFAPDT